MNTPIPGDVAELLAELDTLGIQLEADGCRLRFRPREKMTADLAARMKARKAELLAWADKQRLLERELAEQLAELLPCTTEDGRVVWVHPRYRRQLENLGWL